MIPRMLKKLAVVALSTAVLAAGAVMPMSPVWLSSPAQAQENQRLMRIAAGESVEGRRVTLHVSKSMMLELGEDVRDILVSNPTIVDAVVRTNRRVFLVAQAKGTTNIFLFGDNGRQIASLEVTVAPDTKNLEQTIRRILNNDSVTLEYTPQAVIMRGEVANASEASRAEQVARGFVSTGMSSSAGGSSGGGSSGGGASGGSSGGGGDMTFVNALSIRAKDQVQLKVTVAEVNRNTIKQLGVNLSAETITGTVLDGIVSGSGYGAAASVLANSTGTVFPINNTTPSNSLVGTGRIGNTGIYGVLRALEQNSLMRTLAEPTLTAISGEEANFLVGGEYPIPVAQDGGTIAIEFKKYGVSLTFLPVVLGEGRISVRVMTEVSELDQANGFRLTGGASTSALNIPAVRVRRAETTLEMPSGGAMVLGGLLRDDVRQAVNGVPGLQNLPILGTLFRSRDYLREQTELAIFVQPFIVQPVARQMLQRADKNFVVSNDAKANFLGQLHRTTRAVRPAPNGSYQGPVGFIYE